MSLVSCHARIFASERAESRRCKAQTEGNTHVLRRAATRSAAIQPAPEGRVPHGLWRRCAPGQWEAPFPAGRALPQTMGNALMRIYARDTTLVKAIALALIRAYQLCISPLLGPRCRFQPTCSQYAREAIEIHGLARGLGISLRRILRCHPFGPSGWDPVPPSGAGLDRPPSA